MHSIWNPKEKTLNSTTSQSVDELNDRQTMECLWKASRSAKTPETMDDMSRSSAAKKHVTFAATHLVRSATVGGINIIQSSTPTQPFNERLVNESIQVQYFSSSVLSLIRLNHCACSLLVSGQPEPVIVSPLAYHCSSMSTVCFLCPDPALSRV